MFKTFESRAGWAIVAFAVAFFSFFTYRDHFSAEAISCKALGGKLISGGDCARTEILRRAQ